MAGTKSKTPTQAELEEKIKVLKGIGETEKAAEYEKQLAELTGGNVAAKEEIPEVSEDSGNEFLIGGATEEDWNSSSSKFASVGKHLSEAGMPYWKNQGVSIAFPFVIVQNGPDKGKEGEIICGVGEKAVWKLRQTLEALGVPVAFKTVNGIKRPSFDANLVPGKQFYSEWQEFTDSRTPEQGGKGGKYTKAVTAIALDAVDASVL
jgi:hypothetical protein